MGQCRFLRPRMFIGPSAPGMVKYNQNLALGSETCQEHRASAEVLFRKRESRPKVHSDPAAELF